MSNLKTTLPTDEGVIVTWDEYLQSLVNLQVEQAKFYDHNGQLRIEITPQGYDHS